MPPSHLIDTHHFVKHLTESGFTEKQAEEQVSLLNTNLATKADIEALRQETQADIASLWPHGHPMVGGG